MPNKKMTRKTVSRRTLKDKETGETVGASLTITTPVGGDPVAPKTPEQKITEQFEDELEAEAEFTDRVHQVQFQQEGDLISQWIKKVFKLAGYPRYQHRYRDDRFPLDEQNSRMTVARFYAFAGCQLVVDSIPGTWTHDMIMAKKWAIERIGMRYIWKQEGEIVKIAQDQLEGGSIKETLVIDDGFDGDGKPKYLDFWTRFDRLKKEPKFQFSTEPFRFDWQHNKQAVNV
jgi:hypothetical protein